MPHAGPARSPARLKKGNIAFEFKKKESVRTALRRLGRSRVDKALRDLARCRTLDAVHELRKEIKQLRALLRLVRSAMRRSDYRRCSRLLRKTAWHLAPVRDAHVKVMALSRLIAGFKPEISPRAFRRFQGMLSADCHRQQAALAHTQAPKRVGRLLQQLRKQFAWLRLKRSGWPALAPGLERSYRQGRRGYRLAREDRTPEHFHRWRKRVKDLYYHTGLLGPIRPEQMRAARAELKQLGDCLGADHDLFLLIRADREQRLRKQAPEESGALRTLVLTRQRQLRARALALGASFYAEKTSLRYQRLKRHWERWRRACSGRFLP